jgi:hypothetical protein
MEGDGLKSRANKYVIVHSVSTAVSFVLFAVIFSLQFVYQSMNGENALHMPLTTRLVYSFLPYTMPVLAESYELKVGIWMASGFLWLGITSLLILINILCTRAVGSGSYAWPFTRFIASLFNYVAYDNDNVHLIRLIQHCGVFSVFSEAVFAMLGLQQSDKLRSIAISVVGALALTIPAESVFNTMNARDTYAQAVPMTRAMRVMGIIAALTYSMGMIAFISPLVVLFRMLPGVPASAYVTYWVLFSFYVIFIFSYVFMTILNSMAWFNKLTNKLVIECIMVNMMILFGALLTILVFNLANHSDFVASAAQRAALVR